MIFSSRRRAVSEALAQAPVLPHAGRSPWVDARVRFMRNKAALASLAVLLVIVIVCVGGPSLLPYEFDTADWDAMKLPPTWAGMHWWGTDEAGRDLLVRCLIGGRISLMVGLLATLASVAIGIVWGATAGFLGGRVDGFMMRIVDMMYAIPYLLIAILLVTILGREFYLVVLA
ncbi:MAG: peptide ABC transporter permease, partial [Pseudomonadota bacterium]|nr:peptide ABC transporter permease [Pseudomonadota bacterium]